MQSKHSVTGETKGLILVDVKAPPCPATSVLLKGLEQSVCGDRERGYILLHNTDSPQKGFLATALLNAQYANSRESP